MSFLFRHHKSLALGVGILVVLWLVASLVFAYVSTRRSRARADEPLPMLTWGTAEAFRLTTSDGKDLGASFVPGQADRPICLLLHGKGGCRTTMLERGEIAASTGASVMLVTLRAHGDSSGDYNDIGYSARHDVVAAVEWIERNHPGRPIVHWGESMGAAAAAFAAESLGERVRAYILESPYKDLRTAVSNRMSLFLPPVLDSVAYGGIMLVSPLVIADIDRISPVQAVTHIPPATPVLLLAGSGDTRATLAEARAIASALGQRCQLVVIAKADHGKLLEADPEKYRAAVTKFVESTMKVE